MTRTNNVQCATLARPSVSSSLLNHQLLFQICITLPVESAPFFIPSTSFCSLSSWFTSSYTHTHTYITELHHFLSVFTVISINSSVFTPDLKLTCSTNLFLHSLLTTVSCGTGVLYSDRLIARRLFYFSFFLFILSSGYVTS